MNLSNWKISTKLALMVLSFVIVLATYAALGYNTRQQLQINGPYYDRITQTRMLVTDIAPSPLNLGEAFLVTQQIADAPSEGSRRSLVQKLRGLRKTYNGAHEESEKALSGETNDALKDAYLVKGHGPALRFFDIAEKEFIPAAMAGDRRRTAALLAGPLRQNYDQHRLALEEALPLAERENANLKRQAEMLIQSRGTLQVALLVGSIGLFALVLGPLISRSVTRPLAATVNDLATTSVQLASTIEEHERTAMSQAAAVSETTSAMDELEASFAHTADVVSAATERVQHSSSIAGEGIKTVRLMQDGMLDLKEKVGTTVAGQILRLSEQTSQISTITNQVGDLANQTNMLALNAAVEAARAGEHGKGFAVVAAEIRKLADASRKSAERINTLVEDIQKATNATVMATEESTKTVDLVILRARATADAFTELKEASDSAADSAQQTLLTLPQQVNAVKQVLESMEALNTGARETTNAISQTRTGSETLREAVSQLKSTI
jgi:methyl-accepting chemotaxis protein